MGAFQHSVLRVAAFARDAGRGPSLIFGDSSTCALGKGQWRHRAHSPITDELGLSGSQLGGHLITHVELGRNGRYRTNVWNYPGASKLGPCRSRMHPTVKAGAMLMDAI
jgi:hypothetical protein